MKRLEKRLARMYLPANIYTSVMEIDTASACLLDDDKKELKKEQADHEERRTAMRAFRRTFRERRLAMNAGKGIGKGKGRGRGGGGGGRRPIPSFDHVPQHVAKTYLPPGAFLWRSRRDQAWCARYSISR